MQEITAVEREGDRIACEILHGQVGGGSPLDAADVHALTFALDEVVDLAEEAANRLGLYRVEAAMDEAVDIAEVFVLATRELAAALESLADGAEVSDRLIEVHRLEQEADRLVRGGGRILRRRDRPHDRHPLEGHLRIARGRRRCLRHGRESARGCPAQARRRVRGTTHG